MRYTPYLDSLGITFRDNIPDHVVNIIDNLLERINATIDWGSCEGKKRKPCPEQPLLLTGQPIGQYHCPGCGMMILAAMPHLDPENYEEEYGQEWLPGYEDD